MSRSRLHPERHTHTETHSSGDSASDSEWKPTCVSRLLWFSKISKGNEEFPRFHVIKVGHVFKGKHEAARMELRFINKTRNRHIYKPSYGRVGSEWLKHSFFKHFLSWFIFKHRVSSNTVSSPNTVSSNFKHRVDSKWLKWDFRVWSHPLGFTRDSSQK